ncbi:hypothetical protein ABZ816_26415 [Actinosynnema sp. NPDC047251]|uniref:Uncharacterized protein n=1 Tax=Saccharothrix espanaensis (strain ATCC 51144 / DSM 44229 / JCM 9112 / NBRC 15066 / NRRL 15764) TaxID=1179773 RepID=K0JW89_SACES|nr:hypothetical protein [Saccharothrix espanaensis]CCH32075.1 hypothetical protein BN6_48000 [Saccharothrix espanaensis DSM 44229]
MTLPYPPDDDSAAYHYINDVLRNRDDDAWRLLAAETHVEQTDRVMRAMLDRIAVARTHRTAVRAKARARAASGEITQAEYQLDAAEDATKASKTAHFETLLREHHRQIAQAARRLRGDDVRDELTDLVLALGTAIDTHRAAVLDAGYKPTAADEALWARLAGLDVPGTSEGEPRASVEELVKRRSATQDDLGRVLAGIILDVAGGAPSVPRSALLSAWKKAVAPTLAVEQKTEFAAKGKGSLATEKLRKTMGHLERKGLVKRTESADGQRLDVLDRRGLEDLADGRA